MELGEQFLEKEALIIQPLDGGDGRIVQQGGISLMEIKQ